MWEKARVGWFWENSIEVCILPSAKSLQLCLTLCNPIDGSPPGSPVPGILQARTLEWVAISFSNAWKWKVKVKSLSHIWLLATPWTAAHQAPPSMGFSRQEYWSGVPLLSPYIAIGKNRWPVQVWCMKQGTQNWCSGTTQRGGMGRGFRMRGHTCTRPWFMSMCGKNHHNIVK